MPDERGRLNKSELEKAKEWLDGKWESIHGCSVCGSDSWQIIDYLVTPVSFPNILRAGELFPQVMVICTYCGYTIYFNAIVMGIVVPLQKEAQNGK